jgi:hypothetical protein
MDPAGLAPQLISTIAQRLQQRRPGEYKAQRKGCPKGSQKRRTEDLKMEVLETFPALLMIFPDFR